MQDILRPGEQQKKVELLKELYKRKQVAALTYKLFNNFILTPIQEKIVRAILYKEHKRINLSAMTRWGKTKIVSLALGEYTLTHEDEKIILLGPTINQGEILRNYMSDAILASPVLQSITQITATGYEALRKEASKKKQTFTNGMSYQVFSVEGDANRVMGAGGDVVVKDEAALINRVANTKAIRMLGDAPADSLLVNLINPWEIDSQAFDDWHSPRFKNYHVDWRMAIKEKRVTKEFVDEMRDSMTPLEFTVLYESKFPAQSEDSLFSREWVENCMRNNFGLLEELKVLKKKHETIKSFEPATAAQLLKEIKDYKIIVSCDPADKGLDFTVVIVGIRKGNRYQVLDYWYEAVSDNMAVAKKCFDLALYWKAELIHVDAHGLGTGVVSRLKQIRKETGVEYRVKGCEFGGKPIDDTTYKNMKAENYFRLRNLMKEGLLDLPDKERKNVSKEYYTFSHTLYSEVLKMKWERIQGTDKVKIIDPEDKSPDFCFIAGTSILTLKGDKCIEDIKVGDYVVTPYGNRKVLKASNRVVEEICCSESDNGNVLVATGNHKVYTNATFKYLGDFKESDKLETGIIKWRLKKLLNTTAENIGFRESIITQTSITEQEKKGERRKHYTDKFGKIQQILKFLKHTSCIILMEIPLIILLKILKQLKKPFIGVNIKKSQLQIIKNYTFPFYEKHKKKLKSGTNLKKGKNGIRNITVIHSPTQNIIKNDVLSVIKNLKVQEKKKDFVQENVICDITVLKGLVRRGIVSFVKKSLLHIGILKPNFVRTDVLRFLGGVRVYSIEVEKDHVYYADTFLVSNSDALCYLTWRDKANLEFAFITM